MESKVQGILKSFDRVKINTLSQLVDDGDVEQLITRMIIDGKLSNVKIDGEYVVNMNSCGERDLVTEDVLNRIDSLASRCRQ